MGVNNYLSLIDEIYLEEQIITSLRLGILNEEAIFDKTSFKNPVYIVLMNGRSQMSTIISKATGDAFTHACIAFNSKLDPMYSFGTKGSNQKGQMGFSKASPQDRKAFFNDNAFYNVYVIYVTDVALSMMKERLEWFEKNIEKLKYDWLGLIDVFFNKTSDHHDYKYFCSRFVMEILSQGINIDKNASLYRPQHITGLDNITLVNKGEDIHYYDKTITDNNERYIKSGKSYKIVL